MQVDCSSYKYTYNCHRTSYTITYNYLSPFSSVFQLHFRSYLTVTSKEGMQRVYKGWVRVVGRLPGKVATQGQLTLVLLPLPSAATRGEKDVGGSEMVMCAVFECYIVFRKLLVTTKITGMFMQRFIVVVPPVLRCVAQCKFAEASPCEEHYLVEN